MPAVDDVKTLGRSRISFADEADITEFARVLERFERGEITADEWRVFRLVRGTYGQRQTDDVQMLRVKIPQGILTGPQLHALADVAETHSRGFGHITTRQNVQFHFMKLHDVEPAMYRLANDGLTTREACGSSVRNITACPYAGVAEDEAFDVTPYAEALTRYFLRHPLSSALPRKFKIGFEGCPTDHAKTSINDIGWRARVQNGRKGFRVTIGGGTSVLCTDGRVLYEFLPAAEMLDVAEAVIRVFHRLGDFKHKHRNRMKFLIRALGWERWLVELEEAREAIRASGGAALPFDPDQPPGERAPEWPRPQPPSVDAIIARVQAARLRGPGLHPETVTSRLVDDEAYARWAATNVHRQKQPGYAMVVATIPLGDFTGAQMRVLADLALAYGDGLVRVTPEQDLVFRWVPIDEAPALYRRLAAAGLGLGDAGTVADVTSCPGAESCKLAVTQSRGLGRTLEQHLRSKPELIDLAPNLDIKISGCPNGCGQHHIAGIGFQGSLRKVGGRAVPQYFLMLGGGATDTGAVFGRLTAKIPAHRCPEALERLMRLYAAERTPSDTPQQFFARLDVSRAKLLLADIETLTPETATAEDFIDLGETTEFRPETMDGECSV